MDVFESLENLNVSEECFDSIMGIVEEIISENIYQDIEDKWGKAKYTTKGRPQNKAAKK